MNTIKKIKNNTVPLCFMPDGRLVCYCYGKIVILRNDSEEKSSSIPISYRERLLGWNRLASRLMRFGVRAALALDNIHVLVSIGNIIYEVNLQDEIISQGWCCGEKIRPLVFTSVNGLECIDSGIYFGGYIGNREKKPVNIYHRVDVDKWEVVYTFQQGVINHVHNVVADPYRQCLWVFTGDFDESAAIWKVTDNFQKVERVACNNQKYRGCVAYAIPEGLLYATDAPYADNYIYLMNTETFDTRPLFPLHGSCIYGCQWNDNYVFSSTVEGDGRSAGRIKFFYHGNKGSGIKDDYVHLHSGNPAKGFKELYKEKKDCMSFLFQFGVFKFPYGKNNTDTLYFQPMATNKNDLRLMAIKEIDKVKKDV